MIKVLDVAENNLQYLPLELKDVELRAVWLSLGCSKLYFLTLAEKTDLHKISLVQLITRL